MRTIGTLFSGGEGVGIGARQAGIEHAWGIESDPDIAGVAQDNGFSVQWEDVTVCNPADFAPVDILHASPLCPSFSQANTGGSETENDISLAQATARFAQALQPPIFTLVNVWQYRKSQSWQIIATTLHDLGYAFRYWRLDAADYGVPQNRKRMIMVARKDGAMPRRPQATHSDPVKLSPMFDRRLPWIGWYEAIEDLIPSLPESQFAPWQLKRLSIELSETLIVGENPNARGDCRLAHEPMKTIAAQPAGGLHRAFLVDSAGYPQGDGRVAVTRKLEEQVNTVVSNHARRPMRAFIVGSQYGQPNTVAERTVQTRQEDDPIFTITAMDKGDKRAFIIGSLNAGQEWSNGIRQDTEPTMTISAEQKPRALAQGRVVQMTPRCLARFQSFPDSYVLPESNTLACRVIGNAVPPLLYEAIVRQL